jgi:hypothetical protein
MPPQTSQTVPEKSGDRVSNYQDQVPNERAGEREEEGVQELQEFRSYRMGNFESNRPDATLNGPII